ncbi:hypothetical protein DPMN_095977 [Dreissena polymorpha]|uniref:Major facilitator superfamily (MFS) profile domain-containing protein n=2 Tax=Dreissena polymorpha TaxID=45954 RepID=A0A9D4R430_DREPO|nr:hypothetical protein DPMN_095977 [Dreissena polymorpha]
MSTKEYTLEVKNDGGAIFLVDDCAVGNDKECTHQEGDVDETTAADAPPVTIEAETLVPDGGYGWMIVLGSFLIHVLMGGFERSNGVLYLEFLDRFGRSATETAWVLSIFSTLRLALGPLASTLCNKYSCRFVVMLGSIICSIGILLSAFMRDLRPLYITYGILGGVGRSFTYTPSLIIVGYYFNKRRGLAVGLATAGVGVGNFVFPPVIEQMFEYYSFQGTFLILAAITCNFFVCGAMFRSLELHRQIMKNDRIAKERQEFQQNGEVVSSVLLKKKTSISSSENKLSSNIKPENRTSSFIQRKFSQVKLALKGNQTQTGAKKPLLELSLFRNFGFTALCLQLFLYTLAFNLTFVFLPALAREKGISKIDGALLLSILGIFDAIARVVMSTVLDLRHVKPYRLIIYNAVMFLNAIIAILLPSMTKFWHFAITCSLFGILSGTYISQKSVVVLDILGVDSLASSVGLLLLFQGLSALIGPTVGGMLKDLLGSYDMAFYFGSIGIILGGFMMMMGNIWIYRQKRHARKGKKVAKNSKNGHA